MTHIGGRIALLVLAAVFSASAFAAGGNDRTAAKKRELAVIKARIAAVEKTLDTAVGRRGELTEELRDIERALGKAQSALRDTNRSIDAANARLVELKRQQASEQQQLDAEKAALAAQIRAAYVAGNEDRLKLILNQEDPAQVQRMLAYYDYFNRARTARVQNFNARLARLAELKKGIGAKIEQLADLKEQRQASLANIEERRDARQAVLAKVDASISHNHAELAELKRSEQQLKRLIEKLTRALSDIPSDLDSQSFASLRGKLNWPVAGPHLATYDSLRADGRLHWQGVLIGGQAGAPVHAIAHGRVVYAGWLPHFGLLLIIDHGGGYLSLYAHNQSLYKEVGDWVGAGETVAALGDSGGQAQPALYFEIRHNKEPVDPARWCAQ
ncbi:MAG TPA: peptidoglycan DD-metalloendopeptidase family protein [Gammaproteobacteria bacterium]|nr:peptidoglycan DD-metalloendopeptidase family protein [Gammaproteobacteria bacterium]